MNETPTERVRKKEKREYKLVRPEITAEELIRAKREGLKVRKVARGITPEEYGKVYTIEGYRVKIKDPAELERLAEEKRKEEQRIKETLKREFERWKRKVKALLNVFIERAEENVKLYAALHSEMPAEFGNLFISLVSSEREQVRVLRDILTKLELMKE